MLGTEARLLHAWLLEPVAQLACGLGPLPDALGWTVARTSSAFLRAAWEAWGLQLLAATPPQARLDAQTDAMHASTILLAYNTVKRALAVLLHKGALAAPAGLYASHELAAAAQPHGLAARRQYPAAALQRSHVLEAADYRDALVFRALWATLGSAPAAAMSWRASRTNV